MVDCFTLPETVRSGTDLNQIRTGFRRRPNCPPRPVTGPAPWLFPEPPLRRHGLTTPSPPHRTGSSSTSIHPVLHLRDRAFHEVPYTLPHRCQLPGVPIFELPAVFPDFVFLVRRHGARCTGLICFIRLHRCLAGGTHFVPLGFKTRLPNDFMRPLARIAGVTGFVRERSTVTGGSRPRSGGFFHGRMRLLQPRTAVRWTRPARLHSVQ